MLNGWIWDLVIHFVLGQLDNLTGSVDWSAIKAKFDDHLKAILPHWLAVPCCAAADAAFAAVQTALADQADLNTILKDLSSGDWAGAEVALQALIVRSIGGVAAKP